MGWGSLVWDPGALRIAGAWKHDGPSLPVEFARVSRDGRLTLVLNPGAVVVETLWCELDYNSPEGAQAALAGREGCAVHAIGLWPGDMPDHRTGAGEIAAWALRQALDAVVWTALRHKFGGRDGEAPGNADEAIKYLMGLRGDALDRARDYVRKAPSQIQTSFRGAVIVPRRVV